MICTGARSALGDWPQLQGNPQRTGYSHEKLDGPLQKAWAKGFAPQRLAPQAQPVIAGGRVFLGTAMGTFFALDARSGKELWARKLGGPVLHTAGVENGLVFVPCLDGCVYALRAEDGGVAWTLDSGLRTGFSTAVLLADGKVIAANRGGICYALSPTDGSVVWKADTEALLLMSPAFDQGRVFMTSAPRPIPRGRDWSGVRSAGGRLWPKANERRMAPCGPCSASCGGA